MPSISKAHRPSAPHQATTLTKRITTGFASLHAMLSSAKRSEQDAFADPHNPPSLWPVDTGLTAAIEAFAREALPHGWEVVADNHAPKSLEDVELDMLTGVLRVSDANNTPTIWGAAEANHAFRAWHDYLHWSHHLPFTIAGEAACAYLHCWHLLQRYGHDTETEAWCALILTEVIGQAMANVIGGQFPEDQREFTTKNADVFVGMAYKLALRLNKPDVSAADVMYLAEQAFGRP